MSSIQHLKEQWNEEAIEKASKEIATLKARADKLDALLGDIFAILRINLLRETIKTTDNAEFERIIEGWQKQREEA